ncbi:MAG: hypothetical protein M3159_10295 [Actinomycetota bacterium]|nr:hypothetical protein [Actinomycetota bacterium]
MKVRLVVIAAIAALSMTATACSGGSSKSSAKPAAVQGTSTTSEAQAAVTLPPNIPRSEQFCSLTSALADKFKGAKRPEGPEEMKPYIKDLATFFQQATAAAPAALASDVQQLNQFYASLSARLETGTPGPAVPTGLKDLASASTRLRLYFKGVCGVDDSVFNF